MITGASGGLGQAIGQAFLKDMPCCVALHCFTNHTEVKKKVKQFKVDGGKSRFFSVDLRDSEAIKKMFQNIRDDWGGLDLLINNAAITQNRLLAQVQSADWDNLLKLNLSGVFYCMREAGRIMEKQGKGHIINIASLSAFTGRKGQAAYTASKRGLIALSQTAAREWGGIGIQVNTVCPGILPTSMTATLSFQQSRHLTVENLLGRTSTLEEVSKFIRSLSKMDHVSGQVFNLDSRIG